MIRKKFSLLLRIFKHTYQINKIRLHFIFFKYIFFKKKLVNQKFDQFTSYYISNIRSFSRIKYAHLKEPKTQEWIHSFPGDAVFWDIGANTGIFTFLAAQKNLKVVAIEPVYSNYYNLHRTLEQNTNLFKNVIILPFAQNAFFKVNTFRSVTNEAGSSGGQFNNKIILAGKKIKNDIKTQLVGINQKYLDMILPKEFKSPNYIKIDIDGNDFEVLRNLETILANDDLKSLMIESNNSNTELAVVNYLSKFRMYLFDKEDTTKSNTQSKNLFFKK